MKTIALGILIAGLAACGSNESATDDGGAGGTTGAAGTTAGAGTGGTAGSSGVAGTTGGGGRGGGSSGATGTGGATGTAGAGALPPLTVSGNKLQDPTGKTIVLRGTSLIDIGALYAYNGNSAAGITLRMDKIAAAGVQGHAVRLPVYPKISYNGGSAYCSPLPYPVGTGPTANCNPTAPMNAADYVTKVLKPAIDYARTKNLYAIVDYHQIDNAVTGTSAADATTFWNDVAAQFASYANVLYEPFNEPIDTAVSWATFKPVVQGWIDAIRAKAPANVIIVPSMSWDQKPGDATASPPTGTNLMFTAHIYPGNWNQTFQNQVTAAVARAPVFITEWGYIISNQTGVPYTSSTSWGTNFRSVVDGDGASWIAWVTDNAWAPNMFTDTALTQLTDFGTLTKTWLAAKASSDWVQ
ncbi:MAG TPA: cellulase family glycosylhydrolase [Vicinamibacterales bacterium]|jgi:hypothetical protein|nr:cellulase family glycosylhydrolase [Vicinamibacterales bacterium]HXU05063.1 cellulase family glycosylhydrolase [Polyangia bacterium]